MMNKAHQIESAIVEIAFPNEQLALSQHGLFESFVRKKMFLAISDVFDEFSEENTIYSIEKLEMDLGVISTSHSYSEFESKLRSKLRESIENELAYYSQYPNEKLRKVTHSQSELELICSFLEHGSLRWNASLSGKVSLKKLLKSVIENEGLALVKFLSNTNKRKEIIYRLATQFDSSSLSSLFGLMVQIDSRELENAIDWIISLGAERFELTRRDLAQRAWLEIFQLAILDKVSAFRVEDVILAILGTISSQTKFSPTLVHNKLLSHAKVVQTNPRLTRFLEKILKDYNAEIQEKEEAHLPIDDYLTLDGLNSSNDQSKDVERSQVLALRARLVEAINTGFAGKILPYWSELFRKYSVTTEEVLYTLGQKREARKNIAWKFPEPLIVQIVKLLEPTHYSFIEKMISEPKLFLQAEQELEIEESNAKKSLWEFTLTYLIVERGSRFNRKSYISSVMHQMAAHTNVDLIDLYESLMTLLDPVSNSNVMSAELMELLVELKGEIDPNIKSLSVPTKESQAQDSEYSSEKRENKVEFYEKNGDEPDKSTIDAFYQAVRQGRLGLIEPIWADILKFYGDWFLETLRRLGQHQEIRRNISKTFKDPMLMEIVERLEPGNSRFIFDSIKSITSDQMIRSDADVKRVGIVQEQNIHISKETIWEFTFAYLLVERGSRFNKRSYLSSVIKQLSARENISARAMYENIINSFLIHKKPSASYQNFIDLLKEIGSDFHYEIREVNSNFQDNAQKAINLEAKNYTDKNLAADLPSQDDKSVSPATKKSTDKDNEQMGLIRAYMLYEKLCEELSNAEARGVAASYHIIRLFHELFESYPWKLHRFNHELNTGRWSLVHFIPKLPSSLQRKLLLSYFESFKSNFDFEIDLFVEKISKYEKGMSNNAINYLVIFHRILNDKIFSIDAIFAEDARLSEKLEEDISIIERSTILQKNQDDSFDSNKANEGRITNDSLPLNQRTYDLVRAYLYGNLELDSRNSRLLANVLERILSAHPETLRALLGETIFDKECARRLVSLLPESLLAKVLLLMRAKEHVKAMIYTDLMVVAYIEGRRKIGINISAIHSLKWEFIFNYLIVEGRSFNEVSFTKLFVDFLVKKMKRKDQAYFLHELVEGITATKISSTHVASARVAMILSNSISRNLDSSKLESRKEVYNNLSISVTSKNQTESEKGAEFNVAALGSPHNLFDEEEDIQEDIYVENAGLVLLAPYLPRYFETLGLLENHKFKDKDAAERGAHLLQYMVNGNTNSAEYLLVLNKVLCGIKTGLPIISGIEVSQEEEELSESLLRGIIVNWPALKNTSIDGLKESFLQRQAHFQLKENAWHLLVESKGFDMLLDGIPWNYKTVKHPWMDSLINVDWR